MHCDVTASLDAVRVVHGATPHGCFSACLLTAASASTQEREGGMSPSSSQWPGNHAAERPEFYETLEASIKHVWLDKSSYETYAQSLGVN